MLRISHCGINMGGSIGEAGGGQAAADRPCTSRLIWHPGRCNLSPVVLG